MPGGEAAAAGDELADVRQQRVADLALDLDSHGAGLTAAAAAFGAQDDDNARALPRSAR